MSIVVKLVTEIQKLSIKGVEYDFPLINTTNERCTICTHTHTKCHLNSNFLFFLSSKMVK